MLGFRQRYPPTQSKHIQTVVFYIPTAYMDNEQEHARHQHVGLVNQNYIEGLSAP